MRTEELPFIHGRGSGGDAADRRKVSTNLFKALDDDDVIKSTQQEVSDVVMKAWKDGAGQARTAAGLGPGINRAKLVPAGAVLWSDLGDAK